MIEVVLDTETTGISVKDGHRIVEIGCIELDNLIPTKNKFKLIQLPINHKKKKSHFIIKNNFTKKSVKDGIKTILKEIT